MAFLALWIVQNFKNVMYGLIITKTIFLGSVIAHYMCVAPAVGLAHSHLMFIYLGLNIVEILIIFTLTFDQE
jgi:hypothetical protein